jgi:hypothetical protein
LADACSDALADSLSNRGAVADTHKLPYSHSY